MGYLLLGRFGMYRESVTLKSDLELGLSKKWEETLKRGSYVWGDIRDLWPRVHPLQGGIKLTCMQWYLLLGRFGMYRESVTLKSDLELALSKKWEETLKRGSYVWGDIRDLWPRVHPLQGGIKLTCMQWYLLLGRFGMYRESVTLKSDLELALSKKWEETLKRGSYVWGDIRDLWPRVHPLQGGIKLTYMQWYLLLGRFGMYRESVTLKSDLELALSKKWEETLKRGSYVWGDIRDLWPRVHPL